MSTNRTRPDAGFADHRQLPKGPNGRALCRWCKAEVPRGKRTFCGDACVHEWRIRTQPGYARLQVFKRDQGKCASCDNTQILERAPCLPEWRRLRSFYLPDGRKPVWEMDHILPVVEGGGECGLDNLRTLCLPCHRIVTAALAARRAAARKAVA